MCLFTLSKMFELPHGLPWLFPNKPGVIKYEQDEGAPFQGPIDNCNRVDTVADVTSQTDHYRGQDETKRDHL